ncbi:MAG: hypothetical protein RSB29_02565 [Alistipes sp.]
MEITQTPPDYASLRGELLYSVTHPTNTNIDLQVMDVDTDEVVGTKRLIDVRYVSFDAAPYLRRRLFFHPRTGATGFVSAAGRTIHATLKVGELRASVRTFIPAAKAATAPALLSTMPTSRTINQGECDELTLCTATPCVVLLTAYVGTQATTTRYTASQPGITLFRLNSADFPKASRILLQIEGLGAVSYTLTKLVSGIRVAWRSSAGSIEHYTFPIEKQATVEVEKQHIFTTRGYAPVAIKNSRCTTLLSAYEATQTLTTLEEILTSPAVWRVEEGLYTPMEVVNTASGIRHHGTLRNLEVQLRSQPKITLP